MNTKQQFKIISFYEFINLNEINNISKSIQEFASINKIRGTVIIASEGINGSMAGIPHDIDKLLEYLKLLKFNYLNIKETFCYEMPFYRLKVKIKKEIVSMLSNPINADLPRGIHLNSKEWNDLISNDETLILDIRNTYETDIGQFNSAIVTNSNSFAEFKNFVDSQLSTIKDKKIAMYCTGGIRCEKASFYMKTLGFNDIYQLDGGILKYLEDTPNDKSQWSGECFVFDNRVSVNKFLEKGNYELCRGCNNPISKNERFSNEYEKDVSCSHCYTKTNELKKNKFRERSKQVDLAKEREESYIYDNLNYNQYIEDINLDNL